jgi:hypothetical protein
MPKPSLPQTLEWIRLAAVTTAEACERDERHLRAIAVLQRAARAPTPIEGAFMVRHAAILESMSRDAAANGAIARVLVKDVDAALAQFTHDQEGSLT